MTFFVVLFAKVSHIVAGCTQDCIDFLDVLSYANIVLSTTKYNTTAPIHRSIIFIKSKEHCIFPDGKLSHVCVAV